MKAEDEDVEDDQGQLGRAVDGGDEGEEDEQGVGDQEHPGDDLLRVEGELEAVKTPPFPELLDRGAGAGRGWHPEASDMICIYVILLLFYWPLKKFMIKRRFSEKLK